MQEPNALLRTSLYNYDYWWMNYADPCIPKVRGIEAIEFGGMMPTSVTTAVILAGGVRSYNGLRICRFADDCVVSESFGHFKG